MDDWGGLLAMLASAAIQKRAYDRAAADQQAQVRAAQQRQMMAQDEAARVAAAKAAQFDAPVRQQTQQQIEQDLTGQYQQQVAQPAITAQGVQVGSTIPDRGATTDYLAAKAKEQAKAVESARQLAALMGRMGAPTQLRQREAVGMGDAAQDIGRIQTNADRVAGIDQIGIESAGQPALGPLLAGEALRAYGGNRMATAGWMR